MIKFCPDCELEFEDDSLVCPNDGAKLVILSVADDSLSGQNIDGRYTILDKIGEGGMGAVYTATQEAVGRKVALKVLRRDLTDDPGAVKRFFHEAKVVSKLRHPNTITLYDFGQSSEGLLYIAMEYMTGTALDAAIKERDLELIELVEIIEQVAESLVEAHAHGIVHRDLKPENIFIDRVGTRNIVKVLDFGIAKIQGLKSNLTLTGMVFGTPAYMSPEQAQGFELDNRTDLYSLGVVFFELLCGDLPFPGNTAMKVAMAHILEPVPDVTASARFKGLPPALPALVEAMMAKKPEDRPQDAEDVLTQLRAIKPLLVDVPRAGAPVRSAAGALTGDSNARVAVRERPPKRRKAPSLEATGPQPASGAFDTSQFAEVQGPNVQPERVPRRSRAPLYLSVFLLLAAGGVGGAFALGVFDTTPPTPDVHIGLNDPIDEPEDGNPLVEDPVVPGDEVSHLTPPEALQDDTGPAVSPEEASTIEMPPMATVDYVALSMSSLNGPLQIARNAAAAWEPATVQLTFEVNRSGVVVRRLDTDEVVCETPCQPLVVPQSSDPLTFRLTRRNYEPREVQIVPAEDQVVSERMRRVEDDDRGHAAQVAEVEHQTDVFETVDPPVETADNSGEESENGPDNGDDPDETTETPERGGLRTPITIPVDGE